MSLEAEIDRASEHLARAETLFIFTGSGMSAESGIRTFRGAEGLWEGVNPEDVATPEAFERDSAFVWAWYKERILAGWNARPHAGHKALAKLQALFGRQTLATQNVDGLHERAGSKNVLHLHGSISHFRCTKCQNRLEVRKRLVKNIPPNCPKCGALLRPDVVWFGEALPQGAFHEAVAAAAAADVALVIGTSNLVHPAAGLPLLAKENGARLIEVNPQRSPLTEETDVFLQGTAGQVLPPLHRAVVRRRKAFRP